MLAGLRICPVAATLRAAVEPFLAIRLMQALCLNCPRAVGTAAGDKSNPHLQFWKHVYFQLVQHCQACCLPCRGSRIGFELGAIDAISPELST